MIIGNGLCLRVWRDADLPILTELRNDLAVQAQLLSRARGSTEVQVREWLVRRHSEQSSLLFVIASNDNDEPLGFTQVLDIDYVDRKGNFGICLISDARGRGLGVQVIDIMTNYLRDSWNFNKLSLRVRADNHAALRCYEKAGFERCGLLREDVFIDGRLQNVVLMERFFQHPG